jgi:hypothetical protein
MSKNAERPHFVSAARHGLARPSISHQRMPDPTHRKLLRDQIEAVQNGADPIGTNRDPAKDEVIHLIQDGLSAFSFAAAQANRK